VSVRHPVEFVRERLTAAGCLTIAGALDGTARGRRVRIGGVITHRQRPMTARGVIFLNLEDETGLLNVIVLPAVWQANREVARKSVGVILDGVLEYRDGVTNLVARRFAAWSDEIPGLHSRDWARGRG
jgi:error-prone DNA polymerase